MQFKLYDILSSLLPGAFALIIALPIFLVTTGGEQSLDVLIDILQKTGGVATSVFLVLSYLLGYLIHAFGSWFEPVLWFTWKGRPSELLLTNRSKRIILVNYDQILTHLINKSGISDKNNLLNRDYIKLFQIAKYDANIAAKDSIKDRISEFNSSYIFSRNILISLIIVSSSLLAGLIKGFVAWYVLLLCVVMVLLLWYRCRDRALYYSREILIASYYLK